MDPPPRSLALDAHYCIMVRVSRPTAYKYARAIARAEQAPLGIDLRKDSALACNVMKSAKKILDRQVPHTSSTVNILPAPQCQSTASRRLTRTGTLLRRLQSGTSQPVQWYTLPPPIRII